MSIFSDILVRKPGRSLFNLSHDRKFSCDWAKLYPILCMETVPGDTIKVSTEFLIRMAPLRSPVMHRINVKVHYFFVPNRLLWDKWEDFITGIDQKKAYMEADNSNGYFVNPVPPFVTVRGLTEVNSSILQDGSLADFLGFPTHRPGERVTTSGVKVPLLPFAAYTKIYDDWYRNQNVEAPILANHPLNSGENNYVNLLEMRFKMWEKDYFTSALPFAQRGDPVDIPVRLGELRLKNDQTKPTYVRPTDASVDFTTSNPISVGGEQSSQPYQAYVDDGRDEDKVNIDITGHTTVDGASGSLVGTINDLRLATRIQRWLEKNARVGGRYIEQILAHFGIHSSDARLQRAEYLGGFTAPIVISDIEQNSASTWQSPDGVYESTPQGTLAGKGTTLSKTPAYKCFCEEHGFLIGIMSITPRTTYQDQLSKMWQRENRYDYYFPEFAHLGEQEVNKAEVFFDVTDSDQQSKDRFGFQERYCEYKYIPSSVHGEFKGNLHFWHLGRQFNSQPVLNKDFVQAQPNTDIFAVEDANLVDHFYVNLINHVSAMRPMPKQAIPTL